MRFSHIKDENGRLRITIAYNFDKDSTPSTVGYYGVSCVSISEPNNAINYNKGRAIAKARCDNAQFAQKRKPDGGVWEARKKGKMQILPSWTIWLLQNEDIKKMGACTKDQLKNAILNIRESINNAKHDCVAVGPDNG